MAWDRQRRDGLDLLSRSRCVVRRVIDRVRPDLFILSKRSYGRISSALQGPGIRVVMVNGRISPLLQALS